MCVVWSIALGAFSMRVEVDALARVETFPTCDVSIFSSHSLIILVVRRLIFGDDSRQPWYGREVEEGPRAESSTGTAPPTRLLVSNLFRVGIAPGFRVLDFSAKRDGRFSTMVYGGERLARYVATMSAAHSLRFCDSRRRLSASVEAIVRASHWNLVTPSREHALGENCLRVPRGAYGARPRGLRQAEPR